MVATIDRNKNIVLYIKKVITYGKIDKKINNYTIR